eukprot:1237854-Rhodomonas_salina.3
MPIVSWWDRKRTHTALDLRGAPPPVHDPCLLWLRQGAAHGAGHELRDLSSPQTACAPRRAESPLGEVRQHFNRCGLRVWQCRVRGWCCERDRGLRVEDPVFVTGPQYPVCLALHGGPVFQSHFKVPRGADPWTLGGSAARRNCMLWDTRALLTGQRWVVGGACCR